MTRSRILIVDDEINLVNMLQRLLKNLDYDVAVAMDGRQALELADQFDPDLILLDIKMPDMNGVQVLKTLRSIACFAETPIIVLSAKGQLHEINAGIEAGADTYLCKPVMFDEILNTIIRHLTP
ncbi:MAG: response regulator [Desulfobacteraceae bacterium]